MIVTHQISCLHGVFSDLGRFSSPRWHQALSDTLLPKSEVSLLRDGRPPIFQNLDVGGTSASPIPVAWDQLRAIRDRKESRMGMEDKWGILLSKVRWVACDCVSWSHGLFDLYRIWGFCINLSVRTLWQDNNKRGWRHMRISRWRVDDLESRSCWKQARSRGRVIWLSQDSLSFFSHVACFETSTDRVRVKWQAVGCILSFWPE